MPTLAQIRAAIKAKAEAVADVGKMHDYERYAEIASQLQAHYVSGGAIKGGFVAWRGVEQIAPGNGRYAVTHRWELTFYRALKDGTASEKSFDDMLEAQRIAFRDDENLGGVVSSTVIGDDSNPGPAGLQVEEKIPVVFCGALCHKGRCRLVTRHYE